MLFVCGVRRMEILAKVFAYFSILLFIPDDDPHIDGGGSICVLLVILLSSQRFQFSVQTRLHIDTIQMGSLIQSLILLLFYR